MPRRRALTDSQLEALLALPTAEADLIRHYTLSPEDLAAISRRRRPQNRLGFALQLCALRYPGRLIRPGEVIPLEVVRFLAEQLDLDPDALAITPPARRPATINWTRCATASASAPSPNPTIGTYRRGWCRSPSRRSAESQSPRR